MLRRESRARPYVDIVRKQSADAKSGPTVPPVSDAGAAGKVSVDRLVPYLHVSDVETSLAFYAHLGFSLRKAVPAMGRKYWALACSGSAEIMLAQASGAIDSDQQAVLLYMFCTDLPALRRQLITDGIRDAGVYSGRKQPDESFQCVYEIAHPAHMKVGEMRIIDPDGYVILIGQLE